MIEWTAVQSSNIARVGWEEDAEHPLGEGFGRLHVEFLGGRLYRYGPMPRNNYARLVAAESVGSHFAAEIKSLYEGTRYDGEEQQTAEEDSPATDELVGDLFVKLEEAARKSEHAASEAASAADDALAAAKRALELVDRIGRLLE